MKFEVDFTKRLSIEVLEQFLHDEQAQVVLSEATKQTSALAEIISTRN